MPAAAQLAAVQGAGEAAGCLFRLATTRAQELTAVWLQDVRCPLQIVAARIVSALSAHSSAALVLDYS